MKAHSAARAGDEKALGTGLAQNLLPLADPNFDPVRDARPPEPNGPEDFCDPEFLEGLFRYRALVAVAKTGDALVRKREEAAGSPEAGAGADPAWNQSARQLAATSNSHLYYFMLSKFAEVCRGVEDDACRSVLRRLCALFGVQNLLQGEQWLGLISAEAAEYAEEAATLLCQQLRPDAVALTDAFDFPDRILNSALGKHDGNVYEALYREARKSSINVRPDGTPILRPSFFDAVDQHLDTDFLGLGNANQATPVTAASGPESKL
jgi:hypothetical protein